MHGCRQTKKHQLILYRHALPLFSPYIHIPSRSHTTHPTLTNTQYITLCELFVGVGFICVSILADLTKLSHPSNERRRKLLAKYSWDPIKLIGEPQIYSPTGFYCQ